MAEAKTVKFEVRFTPDEVEKLRGYALVEGFGRRIPNDRYGRRQGNVSKLILAILGQSRVGETVRELAARPELALAPRSPSSLMTKIEVRVSPRVRDGLRVLADRAGFIHGGRGNISAFVRAVMRLRCDV